MRARRLRRAGLIALLAVLATAVVVGIPARRAARAAEAGARVPTPAPLGVTYAGWRGEYGHAAERIAAFKQIGFALVSFVPTYAYAGLNRVDLRSGPDEEELARAVESALAAGLGVIIKPHLDPPLYQPGYDAFHGENHSWRVHCPWRGFFDLDPMADDYRTGVVFMTLRAAKTALGKVAAGAGAAAARPLPPVRIEVGAELMNSVVYGAERWVELLAAVKVERSRLGLGKQVLLSHNFTHHFEIADDFVGRMTPAGRAALARYLRGLDVLSLSQYMDLTAAMPGGERGRRLPTSDEVARALVLHEVNFKREILENALGMKPAEIPPLHIGEFGIGRGGLRHPNLWDGAATPAQEKELGREIVRGHEGLLRYLGRGEGRTVGSAILWVTGAHYDIFGWGNPNHGNPDAADAIRAGLRASARK